MSTVLNFNNPGEEELDVGIFIFSKKCGICNLWKKSGRFSYDGYNEKPLIAGKWKWDSELFWSLLTGEVEPKSLDDKEPSIYKHYRIYQIDVNEMNLQSFDNILEFIIYNLEIVEDNEDEIECLRVSRRRFIRDGTGNTLMQIDKDEPTKLLGNNKNPILFNDILKHYVPDIITTHFVFYPCFMIFNNETWNNALADNFLPQDERKTLNGMYGIISAGRLSLHNGLWLIDIPSLNGSSNRDPVELVSAVRTDRSLLEPPIYEYEESTPKIEPQTTRSRYVPLYGRPHL